MFGVSCWAQRGRECSNGVSAVDEGEECAACDCWVADCEGCACCCMLRLSAGFVSFVNVSMCVVFFFPDVEGWFIFSDARCCRDGRTPIYRAAFGGDLSCLEFLVARNADVNAQTK